MKNFKNFILMMAMYSDITLGMNQGNQYENYRKILNTILFQNPLLGYKAQQQQEAMDKYDIEKKDFVDVKKDERQRVIDLVNEFNKEFPNNKTFADFLNSKGIIIETDNKTGKEKKPDIDNVCGTLIVYFSKIFLSSNKKKLDENLKTLLNPNKEFSLMDISNLLADILNPLYYESSIVKYSVPPLTDGCKKIIG